MVEQAGAESAGGVNEEVSQGLDPRSLLIQGLQLQALGQADAAQVLFERHLQAYPADPAALYSLAVILLKRPEVLKARALLDRAVTLAPQFAPLWFAHASAVQVMGEREAALLSYDRALAIDPDYTEVLINSGVLLRELLRHAEALARFQRVLVTKPDYETALANCAVLLTDFKRSEEATAMFERLLAINPDYDYGLGMLCYERLHRCDWTDFDAHAHQIIDGVRAGKPACKSLALMALTDDAATQQRCAQIFSKGRYPVSDRPLWTGERYRHDRIRIAYVSPDLREHPVGHLMAGVFERHDKARFETIAVSLSHDDGSRLRARMVAAFDHFIDARLIGSRQLAEQLRAMEVDVAIDLAGYTADSRSEVFSHRFAPAQVNYLGYPGTLGNGYMDYLIADRHVIPPEHQRFYDERVLYLPDNYLPAAAGLQIAERTPTRAECGLPETGLVFCSFNHDYKVSPHIFSVWMRILAATPGSVLWLMSRGDASQRNLRAAAQAAGVAPDRLVFAQRVPRVEDHLARYRQADLFLDTHPYNAHTTAADALLAGLPVLTYSGNAFPARVAGSLLHAAGLPELVTHSLADYEALALRLAREPERLAGYKAQLAARRADSALLDADGFTRNLEAVYSAIWRQSQLGGASDALSGAVAVAPLPSSVASAEPAPAPSTPVLSPDLLAADAAFERGNLQKAELLLRNRLDHAADDSQAHARLARLARSVGRPDVALRELQQALNGQVVPADRAAWQAELTQLRSAPPAVRHDSARPRHLLIQAWGYGFWSDLDHVLGQLLLAEITGRTPIVHWGTNSLFRDADTVNAFEAFFEPVSSATLADMQAHGLSFYPPRWHAGNLTAFDASTEAAKFSGPGSRLTSLYALNRSEDVVVSDFHSRLNDLLPWVPTDSAYAGLDRSGVYRALVKKFIRLLPALAARIDAIWQQRLAGRPWLAVHVRGSDKVREMAHLDQVNAAYHQAIGQILTVNPGLGIFLLTDSTPVLAEFQARYGERLLALDCERSDSNTGVHDAARADRPSGIALAEQVLIDAHLAARCEFFLGNGGSNVSVGIRHLKDWPAGMYFLIGDDFLGGRSLSLHDW